MNFLTEITLLYDRGLTDPRHIVNVEEVIEFGYRVGTSVVTLAGFLIAGTK